MDVSSLKSNLNLIPPHNATYKVRRKMWRINRFINQLVTNYITQNFSKCLLYFNFWTLFDVYVYVSETK